LPRNANSRRLNVAILGIPNSGKSTLINKAGSSFNLY
jgi:ribosome biogenesis GTPase A